MQTFNNLEELRSAILAAGGELSLLAWQIRDAYGVRRLGSTVRANISEELEALGVRHSPVLFPDRANELVNLTLIKSAVVVPPKAAEEFRSIEEVRRAVVGAGGVLTVKASELRDAHGVERLGKNVRSDIADSLRRVGIGHFPPEIPDRQDAEVRLFEVGSQVGRLIAACQTPGIQQDEILRSTVSNRDSAILESIRKLLWS